MNTKTMILGIGLIGILAITTTVIARNSLNNNQNININEDSVKINTDEVNIDSRNRTRHRERRSNRSAIAQQQETSIDINSADLNSPHILTINSDTDNLSLNAQIKLNGQLLKTLTKSTEINLSPLLKKGKNLINISGKYSPENATINVKLSGDSTQIDQQSSGSGILDQRLIIFVK